jgi:hypothetical protein
MMASKRFSLFTIPGDHLRNQFSHYYASVGSQTGQRGAQGEAEPEPSDQHARILTLLLACHDAELLFRKRVARRHQLTAIYADCELGVALDQGQGAAVGGLQLV